MACALIISGALACAPAQGWSPTAERTCERWDPPVVCAEVDPDRPLRFDLGGTSIVPGECAVGPLGDPSRGRHPHRGGLVRVAVDDGRGGATDYRWIRARRGTTTWIGVRSDRLWIRVDRRKRCDRRARAEEG